MNPSRRGVEPFGSTRRVLDTSQDDTQQAQTGYALVRMRTMIMLRWVTIIGQTGTVLICWLVLRVNVPVLSCMTIIAAAVCFNIALALSPASRRSAKPWELTAQLSFDVLVLGGLFLLTGGVANPFLLFIVGPVTMASGSRWIGHALFMTVLSIVMTLLLLFFAAPMPWKVGQELQLPFIYNVGQAVGLILTIIFSATASAWASVEAARTYLALQVIEAILSREQKLSALGGLAAAAAHELGTPLATISVVAKELARDLGDGPQKDDAWLLVAQAQRCRDILKRLTDKPELADALHERMSLLQLVTEVVEPWAGKSDLRVEALVWGPPGATAPEIWRQPEIAHALTTIVENAFDFAHSEILVTARFGDKSIAVEVRDDGPGFAPEILARLGEPYVTSRPGPEQSRTGHTGLGLGFFIAKTLLERTHAQVRFRNGPSGGAIVTARWQRVDIQAEEFESMGSGSQARFGP